jgi:protein tyrosine phosphatase
MHNALDELITCGDTGIISTKLRNFMGTLAKTTPRGMTRYQEQFQLLDEVCYKPGNVQNACSDGLEQSNLSKNRYPSILPFNGCRPRLRTDGNNSDYINASFVDGYKRKNGYIVTQGPLPNTVNDFWRMIWEFKCRCIVQLCQTNENNQDKCHMYWPNANGEQNAYGKLIVTLQSEIECGDYVMRKLQVGPEGGEGHVVTQFHYTMWPEHGHPSSTGPIIELIDMLTRAQMSSGNKAITVVCNDGVGRCGAFLCIHSQLERLKTESEVDIFKYLKTARTRRIGLLSELDHYVFCHEVLADFVESFDPYANFKDM